MPDLFPEYSGMSYEQASREAMRLLKRAVETGSWVKDLPERLSSLRMRMQMAQRREPVRA